MECPRCRHKEFSSDGTCLSCNYKLKLYKTDPESEKEGSGSPHPGDGKNIAQDEHSPQNGSEIPPWRQELAQRLEALKNAKNPESSGQQTVDPGTIKTAAPRPDITAKPQNPPPVHSGPERLQKQVQEAGSSSTGTESSTPRQKTIASLGEKVFHPPENTASKNIRELIDSAVSRQSAHSSADISVYRPDVPDEQENKYILLSRTLSGLIDLIIIVLCTGAFIIAADSFSGIVVLDGISIVEYAILFLMIFFLYSVFFLAASGQTVGMMITDLRIVGIAGSRPSIGQLFTRCFGFLLSVLVLGVGLLWSFFDRKNRCFHDRFSDTSIIRL